jgi:hypothetical protein
VAAAGGDVGSSSPDLATRLESRLGKIDKGSAQRFKAREAVRNRLGGGAA